MYQVFEMELGATKHVGYMLSELQNSSCTLLGVAENKTCSTADTSLADGNGPLNFAPASSSLFFNVLSASFIFICLRPARGLGLGIQEQESKATGIGC